MKVQATLVYEVEFPKKPFKLPAYQCIACLTSKIQFGVGSEFRGQIMRYYQLSETDFLQDSGVNRSIRDIWEEVRDEKSEEWGGIKLPLANITSSRFI